jgi:hypothetical protein
MSLIPRHWTAARSGAFPGFCGTPTRYAESLHTREVGGSKPPVPTHESTVNRLLSVSSRASGRLRASGMSFEASLVGFTPELGWQWGLEVARQSCLATGRSVPSRPRCCHLNHLHPGAFSQPVVAPFNRECLLTSEVLYQLSYVGVCRDFPDFPTPGADFGDPSTSPPILLPARYLPGDRNFRGSVTTGVRRDQAPTRRMRYDGRALRTLPASDPTAAPAGRSTTRRGKERSWTDC